MLFPTSAVVVNIYIIVLIGVIISSRSLRSLPMLKLEELKEYISDTLNITGINIIGD